MQLLMSVRVVIYLRPPQNSPCCDKGQVFAWCDLTPTSNTPLQRLVMMNVSNASSLVGTRLLEVTFEA